MRLLLLHKSTRFFEMTAQACFCSETVVLPYQSSNDGQQEGLEGTLSM